MKSFAEIVARMELRCSPAILILEEFDHQVQQESRVQFMLLHENIVRSKMGSRQAENKCRIAIPVRA
jgi:hypothetical protein